METVNTKIHPQFDPSIVTVTGRRRAVRLSIGLRGGDELSTLLTKEDSQRLRMALELAESEVEE
jgi:hypothetical protein